MQTLYANGMFGSNRYLPDDKITAIILNMDSGIPKALKTSLKEVFYILFNTRKSEFIGTTVSYISI